VWLELVAAWSWGGGMRGKRGGFVVVFLAEWQQPKVMSSRDRLGPARLSNLEMYKYP
jgi:hypothetical protein